MSKLISPSEMLAMFQANKTINIKPSSFGKKWFPQENNQLLIELEEGLTFEKIAKRHDRSIGGIISRCKENTYQMYLKNISIKDIIQKVKLTEEQIKDIIEKKNKHKKSRNNKQEPKEEPTEEYVIKEIKEEIIEIKKNIKELIEMIKAIYEFEED